MSRLFSYKMTDDTGFAPNPFWGELTLATCKPHIRLRKKVGDWIAGFTSSVLCGDPVGDEKLVFLMNVDTKLSIAEYFFNPRYKNKIPDPHHKLHVRRVGDNIYRPVSSDGDFEQLPNYHLSSSMWKYGRRFIWGIRPHIQHISLFRPSSD